MTSKISNLYLSCLRTTTFDIHQNQFNLLIHFHLFSDITEVNQLCLAINICFLVLELQYFDTFENTAFEEVAACLAAHIVSLLSKPIASVLRIRIILAASESLRKVFLLYLFHDFFDESLCGVQQVELLYVQLKSFSRNTRHSLLSLDGTCLSSKFCAHAHRHVVILNIHVHALDRVLNLTREVNSDVY